jgi:hypothetical protein
MDLTERGRPPFLDCFYGSHWEGPSTLLRLFLWISLRGAVHPSQTVLWECATSSLPWSRVILRPTCTENCALQCMNSWVLHQLQIKKIDSKQPLHKRRAGLGICPSFLLVNLRFVAWLVYLCLLIENSSHRAHIMNHNNKTTNTHHCSLLLLLITIKCGANNNNNNSKRTPCLLGLLVFLLLRTTAAAYSRSTWPY